MSDEEQANKQGTERARKPLRVSAVVFLLVKRASAKAVARSRSRFLAGSETARARAQHRIEDGSFSTLDSNPLFKKDLTTSLGKPNLK